MEEIKIKLPKLTFTQYQMLIRALKYYQVLSLEFVIDADLTTQIAETIDYIEQCKKIIKG